MKRILCLSLIGAILLSLIPITAGAEPSYDNQYGKLMYTKYDDHIEITYCDENAVSIDIPAEIDGLPVTRIGEGAFANCPGLTNVTIPDSVTSIGSEAFVGCESLTSITIPNSVTSISKYAFLDCGSLNITVDESNPKYSDIDGVLVNKDKTEIIMYTKDEIQPEYSIPSNVTSVGDSAFKYCGNLTSITIPSSVISIGDSAFECCYSLTSIIIPDSVTNIGDYAFYYCESLMSVTIGNGVTSIGIGAFYDTAYYNYERNWQNGVLYIDDCLIVVNNGIPSNYAIKNGTRVIADYAFLGCDSLTSVTIPSSVTNIGLGAFSDCGSLNISVDSGNKNYSDIDGVLVNKDKTEIITYAKDKIQPEYSIPNGVISIGDSAFYLCTSLTSITIPSSVTSIGMDAFGYCEHLTSVTIPSSVTSIGEGAFEGCYCLTSVTIPSGISSISEYVFYYCDRLTSVTIPNGVTSIGEGAFYGCDSLTSITIPNSVISIGEVAFYYCDNLTDVYYGGSETDWQKIDIDEYDKYILTMATIHYNSVIDTEPTKFASMPTVSAGDGVYTVSVSLQDIDTDCVMVAVIYDGKTLTGTSAAKLSEGQTEATASVSAAQADTAKVFIWESMDSMKPICHPQAVNIR